MNWIIASFLMFVSSVVLYLFVRKSSLENTPTPINNLAMFAVPAAVYLLIALSTGANLSVTPFQFVIIAIMAFFCSYLGNVFSLQSIKYAPNPGYSLVLSKSYVVFTTLASIFLFNAELTLKSSLAIVLILIFSAIVMMSGKVTENEHVDRSWILYAMGSFFAWGMLSLLSKYLLMIGVSILSRLIFSMIIVSALILWDIKKQKISLLTINRRQWLFFGLIGISGAAFNYFMQIGFDRAPNIGYVNAINAASIAVLTICSAVIFKDDLSMIKLVGVVGTVAGLIMLLL